VRAVREHGGAGARVGLTDNTHVSIPIVETEENIRAAEQLFFAETARVLQPIYRGAYSEEYLKSAGEAAPRVEKTDFALIAQPTDFLGMNIYSGDCVRMNPDGKPVRLGYPRHYPVADSPWLRLNARAMHWGPRLAASVFGVKNVYVTENGAGYDDEPPVDGEVVDLHRLEYVRACTREMQRGIQAGAPVRGYFLWSLMDNFEWEEGYQRRFGIVYNDFKTQVRTPKASALWYSEVVKGNRIV
jgi:beta-glucosidase